MYSRVYFSRHYLRWSRLVGPAVFLAALLQSCTLARPLQASETAPRAIAGFPAATADASRTGLDRPAGIAIAADGRVFAAIWGNDGSDGAPFRQGAVLSWRNAQRLMSGATPDIVLGRDGDTQVGNPESVAVDSAGRLYVADTGNHRVLVYNFVALTGQQPNFVFGSEGESTALENKFQFTRGLAVDSRNRLFVTDEFNNRILVYDLPISSNNPTPLAQYTGLNGPRAAAVDSSDDIYIADSQNAVVKVFGGPATAGTFSEPVRTLGAEHAVEQCATTGPATGPDYWACPIDLAFDAADQLYVADTPNHRILAFAAGEGSPSAVYGQVDFTGYLPNRGGAAAANTLRSPLGMAFDSQGNLYVADFENDRIQRFPAPPTPPAADITLSVDIAAQRRTISPYIYGMNFAPEALADELDLPINRWGGNATSRYNYQTDISNHAANWYFQNIKESDAANPPDDSAANRFIEQNRRTNTQTLLTLPMSGYVANEVEKACGFDVRTYGPQQDVDPYPPHYCGNGVRADGALITGNNPLDAAIAAPPAFTAGWVNFLKARYGAANDGGVRFYNLDNEPDIWFETHRDVRPTGWKYREFRNDTIAYAAAVKAADPGALLLGPVVNGWTYYWYGAYDGQREDWSTPDDRLDNGDMPFVPWYLQQMKQYQDDNGVRLLDYLDLHYYPQAPDVALSPAGNAANQALRLRATRSLWDPSYVDESWIKDAGPDGGIVQLIPRMRAWVDQYYPGTKLAVTEYNWGALDHMNGALAQADVLGIFGREGLDLATLWSPPDSDQPGAFAFRIYCNYDGEGGKFGDISVAAVSSDQERLAIYAAHRTLDNKLTVVVVNKTDMVQTGALSLGNPLPVPGAFYSYSAADLTRISEVELIVEKSGSRSSFPPQSITMIVIDAPAINYAHHLYLPALHR